MNTTLDLFLILMSTLEFLFYLENSDDLLLSSLLSALDTPLLSSYSEVEAGTVTHLDVCGAHSSSAEVHVTGAASRIAYLVKL